AGCRGRNRVTLRYPRGTGAAPGALDCSGPVLRLGTMNMPTEFAGAGTVVIFGATSESGIELARRLRADGQPVVGVSRGNRSTAVLADLGVDCRVADVLDAAQVRAAFAGTGTVAAV